MRYSRRPSAHQTCTPSSRLAVHFSHDRYCELIISVAGFLGFTILQRRITYAYNILIIMILYSSIFTDSSDILISFAPLIVWKLPRCKSR